MGKYDPSGERVSVALRVVASGLAAVAVATPVHDAGSCWGPYIADAPSSLAMATPLAVSVALWAAVCITVWSLWFTVDVSTAATASVVAAIRWWLAAVEMNREICDGSRPGAGLYIGWCMHVAAAWSLPGR